MSSATDTNQTQNITESSMYASIEYLSDYLISDY